MAKSKTKLTISAGLHASGKMPSEEAGEAGIRGARIGGVSGDQLRSYIERIEKLEEEKAAVATDIKEVFAELKANGFCPKTTRAVLRLRKLDHSERDEHQHMLNLYMKTLGMLPLFEGVSGD